MGRPPKDKSMLMNIPVRIMVTAEQKQLLDDATALEGGELSAWARPVLLEAAKRKLAKCQGMDRKSESMVQLTNKAN